VFEILSETKRLAQQYRRLTGKPLGVTGEVAEFEAARLLGLDLAAAREAGYDATEQAQGITRKLQIKGRCLLAGCKPGQRLGGIRFDHPWDAALMLLLDENLDAVEIYEADRASLEGALAEPGSKARNERGALAVSKFKQIGHVRWRKPV